MATYRLNRTAFREELLNAPWMVEEMRRRAELGKEFAERTAPDAPVIGEGFVASFEVDSGTHGGVHNDRAWASLSNTDPAALSIEFGHDAHRDERGSFRTKHDEFEPAGEHIEGAYTLTHAMDVMRG